VPGFYFVKEAVFPFVKFPGVDTMLGPEMKSTGEVMGTGASFADAFGKAQLAAGEPPPRSGTLLISVRDVDKVPMTVQGERALREELERLKKVERPRISQAIAEAREHGDLKENAEYHAAREQQSFAEGRIMDIEGKLSHAQVIDVSTIPPTGKVIFGVTVDLLNVETDETVTYRIVGDDEADAKQNLISVNSPIARALIGKEEGDTVLVRAPGGDVEYEIDEVRHV
jgi:transcription elongation factor GreA